MKTEQEFHSRVLELINNHNITRAINTLKEGCVEASAFSLADRLDSLAISYSYMVDYMMRGVADPGRKRMLKSIISRLEETNDALLRLRRSVSDSGRYYEAIRIGNINGYSLESLVESYMKLDSEINLVKAVGDDIRQRMLQKQVVLKDIFNKVMTIYSDRSEYQRIKEYALQPEMPFELKAQLTAALTLGLMFYFCRDGFEVLLDIYDGADSQRLQARALTGIALVFHLHSERIAECPEICDRLVLWNDSLLTYSRLREVMMALVRTMETEKVVKKMRDEVIPEIMKLKNDIVDKHSGIEINPEEFDLDNNPEWMEMIDKSGIADKLKELSEMQEDGADIMMPTFSQLKNFPFFNSFNNWFLPFSEDYVDAGNADKIDAMTEMLSTWTTLCDSDKYSISFALAMMPDNQRGIMLGSLNEKLRQQMEEIKDAMLKMQQPEFTLEIKKYVQDIYRFFKLYPRRADFPDPFARPFRFLTMPIISDILADKDVIALISEFYFRREFYAEALPLFMMLTEDVEEATESTLWEKIGFSHHALGNLEDALTAYRKAELLKAPGEWLQRKLASVNKRLGRYEDALPYLNELLKLHPDNINLLCAAAECKMKAGRLPDALKDYQHAEYINPDNRKVLKALANCELSMGNHEKCAVHVAKLLADTPDSEDYILAGDLAFVKSDYPRVVEMFAKAGKNSDGIYYAQTIGNKDLLTRLGVDADDIDIVFDYIENH